MTAGHFSDAVGMDSVPLSILNWIDVMAEGVPQAVPRAGRGMSRVAKDRLSGRLSRFQGRTSLFGRATVDAQRLPYGRSGGAGGSPVWPLDSLKRLTLFQSAMETRSKHTVYGATMTKEQAPHSRRRSHGGKYRGVAIIEFAQTAPSPLQTPSSKTVLTTRLGHNRSSRAGMRGGARSQMYGTRYS